MASILFRNSVQKILALALAIAMAGCTPTCTVIPTESDGGGGTKGGGNGNGGGIPSTAGEGEWSFFVNGKHLLHVQRTKGEEAVASVNPNPALFAPAGSMQLFVTLYYSYQSVPGLPKNVQFDIITMHPDTGTYQAVSTPDSLGVTAYFAYDTVGKYAEPGGTLHIVKFDTTNGVISGTFAMKARKPFSLTSPEDTITNGYFNDVPIISGAFRHGRIGATVNGRAFITPDNDSNFATAYTFAGDSTMYITGVATSLASNGSTDNHLLHLMLVNPRVGTFQIGAGAGEAGASYSLNSGQLSLDSKYGATGTLTITEFNTITHRMKATFELSGQDYPSGAQVSVTEGSIDEVYFYFM